MNTISAWVLALSLCGGIAAPSNSCPAGYEDHNKADYTIQVHEVAGVVTGPANAAIGRACVLIFHDTNDHMLVTSVRTDARGRFNIPGLTEGRYYRLVVKAGNYCAANARILIVPYEPGQKTLGVDMRTGGIDHCSYAELK